MDNARLTQSSILVFLVYVCRQPAAANSTTVEVCSGERLDASCTSGTVLMIDNAVYGRMQAGKCRVSSKGCSADVKSYVEQYCAGRRRCDMLVSDDIRQWAADSHGCPPDQLGYLRVTYYCLPVYEGDGEECNDRPITVTSSNTHLANIVTIKSRRGSHSCPWLIRVSRGQTVNLTLLDFAFRQYKPTTDEYGAHQLDNCQKYAEMYIGRAREPIFICSRGIRQRVLHSHTGKQDIRILFTGDHPSQQEFYFLIHVEVRQTYGCAEYEPTKGEHVISESNDTVQLSCANNQLRWSLNCVDGHWISSDGRTVDCSSNNMLIPSSNAEVGSSTTRDGQAILIVLTVALISTLIVIVVGVVVYLRSKWKKRGMNSNTLDPCLYGTTPYGFHTLPPGINAVDCCDAASIGGCSRARSQRDLCHPATPQWAARSRACPPGTYATTMEMRRNGSTTGGFPGYPHLQHAGGSQMTLQYMWAPCPVHGNTYGRRHPVHHVYDTPLFDTDFDSAGMPSPGEGKPMSPFYHELDGQLLAVGVDSGPTPPPRPDVSPELPASGPASL